MLPKRALITTANNRRNSIATSGQALVELCAALILFVPILLTVIDCLFVFIGASLNESICRDAAQAAAAGPPSIVAGIVDPGATPKQRAQTVIKSVYYSGLPMKVRDEVDVQENVSAQDVPPKTQGGGVGGQVTVTTTIDIYPPFVVSSISSGTVVLKSQHTVPVTYVLPPSS